MIQRHSTHKAYLHYYSAISYETLGDAAHNYSSNKLPLLHLARDNYIACHVSLTVARVDPGLESDVTDLSDDEVLPPPSIYMSHSMTDRKEGNRTKATSHISNSPFIGHADIQCLDLVCRNHAAGMTGSRNSLIGYPSHLRDKADLMPSPLRICKNPQDAQLLVESPDAISTGLVGALPVPPIRDHQLPIPEAESPAHTKC